MTSYPKEGDEDEGSVLELVMFAKCLPPGTKITLSVPCCPKCGDAADLAATRFDHQEWPDCKCGFSWRNWAQETYS